MFWIRVEYVRTKKIKEQRQIYWSNTNLLSPLTSKIFFVLSPKTFLNIFSSKLGKRKLHKYNWNKTIWKLVCQINVTCCKLTHFLIINTQNILWSFLQIKQILDYNFWNKNKATCDIRFFGVGGILHYYHVNQDLVGITL